jgi:hypothetical protein
MNTKIVAVLLGILGAASPMAIALPSTALPSTANPSFQIARFDTDRGELSSNRRDRANEIRDDLDNNLDDILSSDEKDELENALDDGENIDDAVDRLDLSDRRSRGVRDLLRSAQRDLDDVLDSGDRNTEQRRRPPSMFDPGNWQRPNN